MTPELWAATWLAFYSVIQPYHPAIWCPAGTTARTERNLGMYTVLVVGLDERGRVVAEYVLPGGSGVGLRFCAPDGVTWVRR